MAARVLKLRLTTKVLRLCFAAASFSFQNQRHSFLELPAASYNHHEAAVMRTTIKMILSTVWKEICTIRTALLVVLLPPASSNFLELPTASRSSYRSKGQPLHPSKPTMTYPEPLTVYAKISTTVHLQQADNDLP